MVNSPDANFDRQYYHPLLVFLTSQVFGLLRHFVRWVYDKSHRPPVRTAGSYSASTTTGERPGATISTSAWRPGWSMKVWVFSERTSQSGIIPRSMSPRALFAFGSVCRGILLFCQREKWLRKSEQGDKWNRCLIEGMIVLSETGARDEQTTPP